MFHEGFSYSTINSAKSAVQALFLTSLPDNDKELLKRFMRGIFNSRPSLPRYKSTWDVNKIFSLLESWGPSDQLTFYQLSLKTAMLLLVLSGRRVGSIVSICIEDITFHEDFLSIHISHLTKTSTPGKHVSDIVLRNYPCKVLCPVECLKEYLKKSEVFRKSQRLFISYVKPYKSITRDTLSRWAKIVMREAGINMDVFKPHSVRSAVASRALDKDVSLATIMSTIGWRQAETIAKYYNKKIETSTEMAEVLLENYQK